VGNCEEAETTEGRERRARCPTESLLSPVVPVELLADEECLLSVLEGADSSKGLTESSPGGSQDDSSLSGWSMLLCTSRCIFVYYIAIAVAIAIALTNSCAML